MLVGGLLRRWILPLAGAAAMILSAVLPWWKASGNREALDWPVNFLWEAKKSTSGSISVGVVMIALGIIALLLTFVPFAGIPRKAVGVAGFAMAAFFLRAVVAAQSGSDLGDAIANQVEYGLWVAAAGGLVLLA
jgi:hypothetical protein